MSQQNDTVGVRHKVPDTINRREGGGEGGGRVEDFFLEDHMVFRGNSRRQQGKRGDYRQLTDNYLPMTEDRKNIID